MWSREDVVYFLRWCETEFDLPHFDMDLFQMNGELICHFFFISSSLLLPHGSFKKIITIYFRLILLQEKLFVSSPRVTLTKDALGPEEFYITFYSSLYEKQIHYKDVYRPVREPHRLGIRLTHLDLCPTEDGHCRICMLKMQRT